MRLEEIKRICAQRTKGTWEKKAWAGVQAYFDEEKKHYTHIADCFQNAGDAEVIACMANNIDKLIERLEHLEMMEKLRKHNEPS